MTDDIKPIFHADMNNPDDVKLLGKYFGSDAIEKAFGENGGGHYEILENAAKARIEQFYQNNVPPEIKKRDKQIRDLQEIEAARRRQTKKIEPPKFSGHQAKLF